jgi:hypothetical protein
MREAICLTNVPSFATIRSHQGAHHVGKSLDLLALLVGASLEPVWVVDFGALSSVEDISVSLVPLSACDSDFPGDRVGVRSLVTVSLFFRAP